MFFFRFWEVSGNLYLNFQTKSIISNSSRGIALFQVGAKAVRSGYIVPHCQRSRFEVVCLGVTVTHQSMATSSNDGERKGNRLLKERSPYLLQHAYNPVDW